MAERDYYAELGVARDATSEEIGHAFRKLAARYHPDRNPSDKAAEEKFKGIAGAYNVLNDPKARATYDRGGQAQVEAETGFRGFDTTEDIFSHFGDIFGDLFGDRVRRESAQERGEDLEAEITLTFEEAARGGKKTFTMTAPTACEACRGTGSSDGRLHPCPTCRGQGHVSQRARQSGGFFSVTTACPPCRGSGIDPSSICPRCGGRRFETRPRTLEVSIPSAVSDGTILKLRQMGAPGLRGGTAGDLRIHVRVRSDGPFQREGLNLKREVTVDVATAVLGGKVAVPLLEGKAEMTVPPGTQPGQQFRLGGQGLSDGGGLRGDLIVTIRVRIPHQVSDEERGLFEQLRSAEVRP
jgi:molecular chaperone DnaJ